MSRHTKTKNFNFHGSRVRVVKQRGEPWFVAVDICDALGLSNPSKSVATLESDEVLTLTLSEGQNSRGGAQKWNIISESGMYALVLRSRKKEAQNFQRWITREVLPSIRKTGSYSSNQKKTDLPALPAPKSDRKRLHLVVAEVVCSVEGANPPLVYCMIHRRMGVSHIRDLTEQQLEIAVNWLVAKYQSCGVGFAIGVTA